jgi:hypothetical protein
MPDLIIVPHEEVLQEKVSLKSPPPAKQVQYEAEKKELSDNIKKFDRKPRVKVYTENPFSFNAVSLKKDKPPISPNQTANQMITDPTYNTIGKFLGIDTVHDWGKYYDKVYVVTEWAKQKVGDDRVKIMNWLTQKIRQVPSMGSKKIDDLHIAAKLEMERKHGK